MSVLNMKQFLPARCCILWADLQFCDICFFFAKKYWIFYGRLQPILAQYWQSLSSVPNRTAIGLAIYHGTLALPVN